MSVHGAIDLLKEDEERRKDQQQQQRPHKHKKEMCIKGLAIRHNLLMDKIKLTMNLTIICHKSCEKLAMGMCWKFREFLGQSHYNNNH